MPRTKQSVLAATALAAVLIVAVAVAISQAGGSSGGAGGALRGAPEARALFRGIPEHGIVLGDPGAPVTLTEFADLQCPFCRQYAEAVLPTLVTRYVRSGQLDAAAREAQRFQVDSTPSFVLSRAGGQPGRLSPSALTVDEFAGPIDKLIGLSHRAHTFAP